MAAALVAYLERGYDAPSSRTTVQRQVPGARQPIAPFIEGQSPAEQHQQDNQALYVLHEDPLTRRFHAGKLLEQVHNADDLQKCGLTGAIESSSDDAVTFALLQQLYEKKEPWAFEYIKALALGQGAQSQVACAILLLSDNPAASEILRNMIRNERAHGRRLSEMPILKQALETGSESAKEIFMQTFSDAEPEERAEYVRSQVTRNYDYLSGPNNPQQGLMDAALLDPSPLVVKAAAAHLLDESNLVKPGAAEWSGQLLLQTFEASGPEGQLLLLDAVRDQTINGTNIDQYQVGNIAAIHRLISAGSQSPYEEVRRQTEVLSQELANAIDAETMRTEVQELRAWSQKIVEANSQ